MSKKLSLFLIVLAVLAYFAPRDGYAQNEPIVREDEYGRTRVYEGEQQIYKFRREEAKRIKAVADEFVEALMKKDADTIVKMSYYQGFASERRERAEAFIYKYHDGDEIEVQDIDIKSIKTDDQVETARVLALVATVLKSKNKEVEQAPSLEKWVFVYRRGKWRFVLE